jgi:hypothetical protein
MRVISIDIHTDRQLASRLGAANWLSPSIPLAS